LDKNPALTLLRILRRNGKGGPLTDAELRKLTGFHQTELDIAAEGLKTEGMLLVERTYTLAES
jgi:hypothetical protein